MLIYPRKSILNFVGFIILIFTSNYDLSAQDYLQMIEEGNHPLIEIQKSAKDYFTENDTGQGSGYKEWKRWEYNAIRATDENGFLKNDIYYFRELARYNAQLNKKAGDNYDCKGDWKSLGPDKISGRTAFSQGIGRLTSIAIDVNDANHILVGSQTGGIWKSTDGGKNWIPLTDRLANMRVYSLAIDPHNSQIYYWGLNYGSILKSTDAGKTWREIEYNGRGYVNKILINPKRSSELWLSDSYKGIFHSTDSGKTWTQVVEDRCYDIELDKNDSNRLYASGLKIWASVDAGHSFQELNFPFAIKQPIMISVSEDAPNNVYALQSNGKRMEGFYISYNRGKSFEKINLGGKNLLGYSMQGTGVLGQAPRNMEIIVSDTDSNEIFVAGINIWRSMDGGKNFSIFSHHSYSNSFPNVVYTHADIEILVYDQGGRLFIGSDGGLFRVDHPASSKVEKSLVTDLSAGLNIQQIYRIGISQSKPTLISVGAQDNGSSFYKNESWLHYHGGDGTETLIIDNESNTLFCSSQNGTILFSENEGKSTKPVQGLYTRFGTGKWVTALEKDPNDTNVIYAGYDVVYRSRDLGKTFDSISQNFHPSHIKVAPTGSDTIYAASASNAYRTTDGGKTKWDRILYANVNRNEINYIAVHPKDANLVALAVGGSTKVLLTRDGGENWIQLAENLPSFQALTIVWQNDTMENLYLGMDVGVYHRNKTMKQWELFSDGLPNIKVNELEINEVSQEIFAATYGRGVWVSPLCGAEIASVSDIHRNLNISINPNPVLFGDDFELLVDDLKVSKIQIFNSIGVLVFESKPKNKKSNHTISTQQLNSGTYFLRLTHKSGVSTRKFIVQ